MTRITAIVQGRGRVELNFEANCVRASDVLVALGLLPGEGVVVYRGLPLSDDALICGEDVVVVLVARSPG